MKRAKRDIIILMINVRASQKIFQVNQEIRRENSVSIQFSAPQMRSIKPAGI